MLQRNPGIGNIIRVKEKILLIHSVMASIKKQTGYLAAQYVMVVTIMYLREEWQCILSACCEETPCDTDLNPMCI
jgi:hypothetical protein